MEKLLLLSVLVMMVVIPLHAAKLRDHKKALRRSLARFFAFNLVYWAAVVFIWFGWLHGSDPKQLLHAEPDSQGQGQSR
jgi:hypothetical protein